MGTKTLDPWVEARLRAASLEARREALTLVNRAREAGGAPPLIALPRGFAHSETLCVLVHALSDVGVRLVRQHDAICARPEQAATVAAAWGVTPAGLCALNVPLPWELRIFVDCFDDGYYRDLVAGVA